jgi:hypothetical protein
MDGKYRRATAGFLLAALSGALIGVNAACAGGAVLPSRLAAHPHLTPPMLQPQPPHPALRDKSAKPPGNNSLKLNGIAGESQDQIHKPRTGVDSF